MRDERRRDGLASARLENTTVMRRKDFFHLRLGNGAPDRIRTCGPQIRNLVLYPAELRAPKEIFNWPPAILSQPVRVNEKTGDIRLGSLHEMRQRVLNSILDFRSEEHTSELQSLMRNSYAVC